jgi:cell pole-organizing protein PopZ
VYAGKVGFSDMSKPDAASGSLESILASIRKSLSEQSVEAGSEERTAPTEPVKDAARKTGLTQRLVGGDSGAATDSKAGDDLADLLEEQPAVPLPPTKPVVSSSAPAAPGAAPAPVAAAPASTSPPEEDPLWFLTRKEGPAAGNVAPVTEAILTPPEVVRATMPPFFGSTAEVLKPDTPQHEAREAVAVRQQPPPPPVVAATAPAAAAPKAPVQPPAGPSPHNGRATEPAEAKGAALGDSQYTRALEAAVLDLLKPMLAQWLDRNMPRLVAEALKEEASRARAATESVAKKA